MLATALYSPWLSFKSGLYEAGGSGGEEDMRARKEVEGEGRGMSMKGYTGDKWVKKERRKETCGGK